MTAESKMSCQKCATVDIDEGTSTEGLQCWDCYEKEESSNNEEEGANKNSVESDVNVNQNEKN